MYKVGKIQKINPIFLLEIISRSFDTATFGYILHNAASGYISQETANLKVEAEKLAKAGEKIEKILGNDLVNRRNGRVPNFRENRYQNFENWSKNIGQYRCDLNNFE